jgi:predicted Zn-dependent protease
VPITGRKQLNIIPNNTLMSQSITSYGQFLQENKVLNNSDAKLVQRVGRKIQNAVEKYMRQNGMKDELEKFAWEFNLVESNEVNAWCMPGGKVVFYTGILKYTQGEAGIATIMGHEVAHAVAKHGAERMSQTLIQQFGGVALNVAMEQNNVKGRQYWMAAYGAGTSVGITLPFSRLHETEADKLGMIFMAMAGYDPAEAISFWERMAAGKKGSPPEFLSTHPSDERRIKDLQKYLPKAKKYFN